MTPLYKENSAGVYSNNVRFQYLISPKTDQSIVNAILVSAKGDDGKPTYKELVVRKNRTAKDTNFWRMKAAFNAGLLRFTFKDIVSVEGFIHGGINTVFGAYGGVDVLGFDGQYGGGISVMLFNSFLLRFGIHHFSGHWGDEILADFYCNDNPSFHNPYIKGVDYEATTEYTRNNSYYFDLGYKFKDYFTFTFETELPQSNAWIRPASHVPANTTKPHSEESPLDNNCSAEIWEDEGFLGSDNSAYPSSYRALRFSLGLEGQYWIKNIGRIYAAGEIDFHQDGKIDPVKCVYDKDRPWEVEYSAALGFAFARSEYDTEFVIEASYHSGRFPLLNYFFKKTSYLAIGIGVNL